MHFVSMLRSDVAGRLAAGSPAGVGDLYCDADTVSGDLNEVLALHADAAKPLRQ